MATTTSKASVLLGSRSIHRGSLFAHPAGAAYSSALSSRSVTLENGLLRYRANVRQLSQLATPSGPRRWSSSSSSSSSEVKQSSAASDAIKQRNSSDSAPSSAAVPTKQQPSDVEPARSSYVPRNLTNPFPPLAEIPSKVGTGLVKFGSGAIYYTGVALKWTYGALHTLVTDPAHARKKTAELWSEIKHEAHHYYLGSKLFVAEVRTSTSLLTKIAAGRKLTRRERLQLRRTLGDLFRIVPFIIIVIIPFAELALPVLLKLFPNMLPSQFVKAEFRQEQYRKALNAKLELHGILQEVLQDRIRTAAASKDAPTVEQVLSGLKDVRSGRPLSGDALLSVASLFKDEITLDNMERGQLAVLAKYMGLSPFTPEPILRFQLRAALRAIKEDDADLAREGTASLTVEELKSACEMRGMRAADLPEWALRAQLDEWLELRVNKQVPATIMMLSRGFQIASIMANGGSAPPDPAEKAIQEAVSSLDERTVTEVVLASTTASASPPRQKDVAKEVLEMRLDSLEFQNELIEAEREAMELAAESEQAAADAADKANAAEAAKTDPARAADEIAALVEAANNAAKVAAAKQEAAARKAQAVSVMVGKMNAAKAAGTNGNGHGDVSISAVKGGKKESVTVLQSAAASLKAQAAAAATNGGSGAAQAASLAATTASSAAAAGAVPVVPPHATTPAEEKEALRALAAGATVARERALLSKLRRVQAQIEAQEALAKGRIIAEAAARAAAAAASAPAADANAGASSSASSPSSPSGAAAASSEPTPEAAAAPIVEVDRGTAFLKRRLDAMMSDLEKDLEKVKR